MGKQPRLLAPSEQRVEVVACHPKQDIVAAGYERRHGAAGPRRRRRRNPGEKARRRAGHRARLERGRHAARLRHRERRGRHHRSGLMTASRSSMYVKFSAAGGLQFEDRDNFRAFKLVVEGDRSQLDRRAASALVPAKPNCRMPRPLGFCGARCATGRASKTMRRGSGIFRR